MDYRSAEKQVFKSKKQREEAEKTYAKLQMTPREVLGLD